jgi:hypothetical protein
MPELKPGSYYLLEFGDGQLWNSVAGSKGLKDRTC